MIARDVSHLGPTTASRRHPRFDSPRERGSAYVAILATTMLVVIIGVAGLTANRLAAQTAAVTSDAVQARLLAQSAIDLALLHIANNPNSWRQDFADQSVLNNQPFGRGTLTVTASDPEDGNLTDNDTQPVVLRGIGRFDHARVMLEVTVDGEGEPIAGSWRAAVD